MVPNNSKFGLFLGGISFSSESDFVVISSRVYQTRAWPQATHEAPTGDRCKAGPISKVHMKVLICISKYRIRLNTAPLLNTTQPF